MASPFLPPIPGTESNIWAEEDKKKRKAPSPFVVNTNSITQGKTEYWLNRAQTLGSVTAPETSRTKQFQPISMGQAYRDVGMDMADNTVQKDKAWWQSALGVLEPLKYLDIPMELAVEVVEGVIPGKWAGEGTAEREDFEAWKALFGSDNGGIKDRLNKAFDAVDKRPLWAQLGLGALQIASTFGTGAIVKGAAASGTAASKLLAASARAAKYGLDPAEGIIKATGAAVKPVWTAGKGTMARTVDGELRPVSGSENMDIYNAANQREIMEGWANLDTPSRMNHLFGYNTENTLSPRYGAVGKEGSRYQIRSGGKLDADTADGISPVLHRGNEFRRLFGDLWNKSKDTTLTLDEQLESARDLALIQMQLSMAARPGSLNKLTRKELDDFLKTGQVTVTEGSKEGYRTGKLSALDDFEAETAVAHYLGKLDEWIGANNLKLDDSSSVFAIGDSETGSLFSKQGTPARKLMAKDSVEGLTNARIQSYKGDYDITENARHIRNQRATEMWFEGWEFKDIQQRLAHKSVAGNEDHITRNYLHDIDIFIGKPQDEFALEQSVPLARILLGARIMEKAPSSVIEGIAGNVMQLRDHLNRAREADVWGQRKGKTVGGAAKAEIVTEVGEVFMRSDELLPLMDEVDKAYLDKLSLEDGIPMSADALELSEFAVRLDALRKLALNMGLGYDTVYQKKMGIWSTSKQAQGKVNRAGYILGKDEAGKKTVEFGGDAIKRAEWAKESGFDKTLGDGMSGPSAAKWDNWAKQMMEEEADLQLMLDDYASVKSYRAGGTEGKLTKTAHKYHEVLAEYIDVAAIRLRERWKLLDKSATSPLGHIDDLIERLRWSGSGISDMSRVGGANAWKMFNKFKSDLLKNIQVVNRINPIDYNITDADELYRDFGGAMHPQGRSVSNRVQEYAGHKVVITEFEDGTRQAFYQRSEGDWAALNKINEEPNLPGSVGSWFDEVDPDKADLRLNDMADSLAKDEGLMAAKAAPEDILMSGKSENIEQVNRRIEGAVAKIPVNTKKFGFMTMQPAEKNTALRHWLQDETVQKVLKVHRIQSTSSVDKIKEALVKMSAGEDGSPNIFGKDFTDWAKANVREADDYLEEIASRMAIYRSDMMQGLDYGKVTQWDDFIKRMKVMPTLRIGLKDPVEIARWSKKDFHGISTEMLAKSFQSVENVTERIKSNKWLQKLNSNEGRAMQLFTRNIATPLVAMFAGGQAAIARPVTKHLSARSWLYAKHEKDAVDISVVAQRLMKDHLGLQVDEATDELRKIGIDEGNEFFSKLVVKDEADILAFESLHTTKTKYEQMGLVAGQKGGFQTPWHKIKGITRQGELEGQTNLSSRMQDPNNLVRQVDVVLERILPEHWQHYFKLSDDQLEALHWMKDLQNQIDLTARTRGVDIVSRVRDKGGKYLVNYFPRLYRMGKDRVRLGQITKEPMEGLQVNNYMSVFEPRQQPDILDKLAPGVTTAGRDPDLLRTTIQESAAHRIGAYYETMMKEGTDQETKKALLDSDIFKRGSEEKQKFRRVTKDLDNLERILNDRRAGKVVFDTDYAKRIQRLTGTEGKESITGRFAWLADDSDLTVKRADSEYVDIMKWIGDERIKNGEVLAEYGDYKVVADNWLGNIFNKLSDADKRAAQAQLELVTPTILAPLKWAAQKLYGPTQLFRTMKAGIDIGAPMIHGYNALVRMPILSTSGVDKLATQKAWKEGWKEMRKNLWNPDRLDNYTIENFHVRQEAGQWVKLGQAEPLGALVGDHAGMQAVRDWFSKNFPKGDAIKMMDRFQNGFVGYTDTLRIELWKAFKPSIDRGLEASGIQKIQRTTPTGEIVMEFDITNATVRKQYHDLGATINKMTGVFDQELAQMTPMQRLLESSIIFFAPMYRRATYGIIADIARGGIRQKEAINQLSGVVGVGAMIGVLAEMTGNNDRAFVLDENGEPDLTARFGKINVGGLQIGIGTAWWTAFRAASDVAMLGYHGDDTIEAGGESWADWPIIEMMGRRGRSQLAPGAGYLLDVVSGRTFTGDPLRDADDSVDWSEVAKHSTSYAIPFWLDAVSEGGYSASTPLGMAAEMMGFQAYKISDYDKLSHARMNALQNWNDKTVNAWREKQLNAGGKVNWTSLPRLLQDKIDEEHPNVRSLKDTYEREFGKVAQGTAELFREYMTQKGSLDMNVQKELALATLRFEKGEIDGSGLNTAIRAASLLRRQGNNSLLGGEVDEFGRRSGVETKFSPLREYFQQLRAENNDDPKERKFQGDIIYNYWMADVVHHPSNIDDDGSYNIESYRRKEQQFFTDYNLMHDKEMQNYLHTRKNKWQSLNPVLQEFEAAKDSLEVYWRAHDLIWAPGTKMNRIATDFMALPGYVRRERAQQNKAYALIQKAISKKREQIRDSRRDIDALLVQWYPGYSPRHESSRRLQRQLQQTRHAKNMQALQFEGSHPWDSPRVEDIDISPAGRVRIRGEQLTDL